MGVTVGSETLNPSAMSEQPVSLISEPSLQTCLMSSLSAALQFSSKADAAPEVLYWTPPLWAVVEETPTETVTQEL